MKRISAEAYTALRNAIPVTTWNKRPFETLLRTALRDNPELLAGLNFNDMKRNVADELVDRLMRREDRYQEVTLQLMLEFTSMTQFPNVEQIKDPKDRELRLDEARRAVANLKAIVGGYAEDIADAQKEEAARKAQTAQETAIRRFNDDIEALRIRFMDQQSETDTHCARLRIRVDSCRPVSAL